MVLCDYILHISIFHDYLQIIKINQYVSSKLVFVNIKNSYDALLNNDRNNPLYRESAYDCTVRYWRIADDKAAEATHILGCYKGKVIEVVKINCVDTVREGEYAGRKKYEGEEEFQSPYLGLDLHEVFDSLANFNTKY